MDCSPPGSSVHGIHQARILEWVAIPFWRGSSQPGIELVSPSLQADSLPSEPLLNDFLERLDEIKHIIKWKSHSLNSKQMRQNDGLGVAGHMALKRGTFHFLFTLLFWHSVQFSSVAQLCLTVCDPMNRSTPGLPVHNQHPEFTQTRIHQVSDAIQLSHPLSSPSPPAPNPSQHQSLFQWVNSLHEVAKVLEFLL